MTISTRARDRSTGQPMLEREVELRAIEAALVNAEGGAGSAIVIVGEPGIGKSSLAKWAADSARARGLRVLRAQGGELERALPYGTIVDLFGPLARDDELLADLFTGPARIAAPLLGIEQAGGTRLSSERPDPVAYVHGLFWLLLNLVERGPLLLVVDDAHWADEPSLRFLHHLVQRIDELPAVVLLAMRPDGDGHASGVASLLRAHREATHLTPGPLTEGAVGELVARLGRRKIDARLRRACWKSTRGNPFFVTELATELANAAPTLGEDDAVPLPERIGRFVEARLTAAEPAARRLAEAIAVLGESATLRRAGALAGGDPEAVEGAVRWLAKSGILDNAAGLAFRHPIVRSAAYALIPGPARASLHRRAALLLADDGSEIGVIGAQLCEAEVSGDPRVVELLVAAADAAVARGEPDVAATLLRRALAEPPPAAEHIRVLSGLARAEATAGSPAALETYGQTLRLVDDPGHRAALQLELGHTLVAGGQWATARETFERGLADAPDSDHALRARLEAGFLAAAWITMEDRAAIGERLQRILASEELGAANRELATWIAFQQGAMVTATADEMGALVKRVLGEAPIDVLVHEGQVVEVGVGVLIQTDELLLEVDVLTRALDATRRTGPIGKAGVYAYCRSWPNYYLGRLSDAIADAEEAIRASELGWEAYAPAAVTVAALAHIERDELREAEDLISVDDGRWGQRIDSAMLLPLAAGRLALARGDAAGGVEHLRRAADGSGAAFMRNPGPTDWRSWMATALLGLDRRDEAREVAAEHVALARAWGAAWPLANALRVAGLVEGGAGGIRLLREAEALVSEHPALLERVRVLVDLGAALRRNGSLSEARDVLSRGADLARQIGARALLARGVSELRAAGARPRRIALSGLDSLTPAELRVANEAIAGRTNREIAQVLFVTPKAVEFHLANAYRKLGIGSRSELAGAIGTVH